MRFTSIWYALNIFFFVVHAYFHKFLPKQIIIHFFRLFSPGISRANFSLVGVLVERSSDFVVQRFDEKVIGKINFEIFHHLASITYTEICIRDYMVESILILDSSMRYRKLCRL